jgi:hypothetical protein
MRTNLITHFYCSNCGNQINFDYDKDDSPKKVEANRQTETEPTGACCRYNRILVEPCKHCIEKHTRPAKDLANAIKALAV